MKPKLQHWLFISICIFIVSCSLINTSEARNELSLPNQSQVLERLSFGINTAQLKDIKKRGIEAYIRSQLNPESISESSSLNNYLAGLKFINQQPIKLQREQYINKQKLKDITISTEQKIEIEEKNYDLKKQTQLEAIDAHLARAINSPRQLQEVMVDFWFNHFNVVAGKGTISLWIDDYENKIRANALGSFRDLLGITASHPAMLIYLDNYKNTAYSNPNQKNNSENLNENYARELMELHTLGIDGGYTQEDIIALAKIFTGWRVDYLGKKGDKKGFFFDEKRHDQGEKVFLGHKIEPKGIAEGQKALDILATHPATAKFISYKLAQYFVADQPPSSLVDKLAQKFIKSDGNIKVIMDTLIHDPEFNDPKYYQQKFKTPYQYIVSLVRISEIEQPDYNRIRGMISSLSMPIYSCIPPTGYKNTQDVWLNSQAMLQRIGFAAAIANASLNKQDPVEYQKIETNLGKLSAHTTKVIAKSPGKLRPALILGSPEAMYR